MKERPILFSVSMARPPLAANSARTEKGGGYKSGAWKLLKEFKCSVRIRRKPLFGASLFIKSRQRIDLPTESDIRRRRGCQQLEEGADIIDRLVLGIAQNIASEFESLRLVHRAVVIRALDKAAPLIALAPARSKVGLVLEKWSGSLHILHRRLLVKKIIVA